MAKAARGLPVDFDLNLPDDRDERPVHIGDFLEEQPPTFQKVSRAPVNPAAQPAEPSVAEAPLRPEVLRHELIGEGGGRPDRSQRRGLPAPIHHSKAPGVIRYQLNLSPRAKNMLEELVKYVCTYSPENDARTSEVFQGLLTLVHNAMDELDLSELPRRGAWGSVTARNFPTALSEAFEDAILRAAQRRGRV